MKEYSVAAASSVAATGALASTPGAALQTARAMAVLALSECHFRHDVELSFPMSAWPGFVIGPVVGGYYRGAVVANVVTLFAVAALGFLVAFAAGVKSRRARPEGRDRSAPSLLDTLLQGMRRMRYPGILAMPSGLLLIGLSACTTAAFMHGGQRTLDIPIVCIGVVVIVAYVGGCCYIAESFPVRYGLATSNAADTDDVKQTNTWVSRLFGEERPVWVPRPRDAAVDSIDPAVPLKAMYPLYAKYHPRARSFYAFDAALTVCVGAAQGTMPNNEQQCIAAIAVVLAVSLVALVAAVAYRPNDTWSKNVVLIVVSLATVLAATMVAIGFAAHWPAGLAAGQTMAVVAGYTSAASVLLTIGRFVMLRHRGWRARRRGPAAFADNAAVLLMEPPPLPERDHAWNDDEMHATTPRMPEVRKPADQREPHRPTGSANDAVGLLLLELDDTAPSNTGTITLQPGDALDDLLLGPEASARPLRISRTQEGQRLFDELEGMLRLGAS